MTATTLPAIDHLSADAKRQLLALLARDLMAGSCAPVSVTDAAGEVVVYSVPANARARAERAIREADPAYLAELERRAATSDDSFSHEEALRLVMQVPKPDR